MDAFDPIYMCLIPYALASRTLQWFVFLEHHHGGQREVILVVRVEEFGR